MDEIKILIENNNKLIEEITRIRKRIDVLEKQVSGHSTLLVDLRGQTAVDFHTSFEKSDNIS